MQNSQLKEEIKNLQTQINHQKINTQKRETVCEGCRNAQLRDQRRQHLLMEKTSPHLKPLLTKKGRKK